MFRNDRSRRRDLVREKIVQIGAIRAIFRPFEVFGVELGLCAPPPKIIDDRGFRPAVEGGL